MFLDRRADRTEDARDSGRSWTRATGRPTCRENSQAARCSGSRSRGRLIVDPKILVADEPTGNLDRATGESIIELFKSLAAEEGLAILITTHNAAFGYEADRVITLQDGRIVKEEDLGSRRAKAPKEVGDDTRRNGEVHAGQ